MFSPTATAFNTHYRLSLSISNNHKEYENKDLHIHVSSMVHKICHCNQPNTVREKNKDDIHYQATMLSSVLQAVSALTQSPKL
jgi:hypothetical protein